MSFGLQNWQNIVFWQKKRGVDDKERALAARYVEEGGNKDFWQVCKEGGRGRRFCSGVSLWDGHLMDEACFFSRGD